MLPAAWSEAMCILKLDVFFRLTNKFSVGFLSSLDILLAKTITHQPWKQTHISTPRIDNICPPGKYFNSLSDAYFCSDNGHTRLSVRCSPCPQNTFADKPDQTTCQACDYGMFAPPGSSSCVPCSDDYAGQSNAHCLEYTTEKSAAIRRVYLAIFVPLGIIAMALALFFIFWRCKRRKTKRGQLQDQGWLLSFDELVRPPLKHMSTISSPSMLNYSQENWNAGGKNSNLQDAVAGRRSTVGRLGMASFDMADYRRPSVSDLGKHSSQSDPDLNQEKARYITYVNHILLCQSS